MPCLLVIMMSLYIFPVTFTVFPIANSKMILALVGLGVLLYEMIRKRQQSIWIDLIIVFVLAGLVSVISLLSVSLNNTNDMSYATYIVSMVVWLTAAYFVCKLIIVCHGHISTKLICLYFIIVCALQCVVALGIEFDSNIKGFFDTLVLQNQESLTKGDRLYGFGASLDTAGTRFSVSLLMIVYLLYNSEKQFTNSGKVLLVIAYFLITVVGNMIARTTLVGVVISIVLLMYLKRQSLLTFSKPVLFTVIVTATLVVPLLLYLYHNNSTIYQMIRFGFEPFFNYAEGGEFATTSNLMLKDMYVFPTNIKTWVIGDGYFMNPNTYDPYYVGQSSLQGFYMGTDVGYSRLIFYFGLLGLLVFMFFFIFVTKACCHVIPCDRILFVFITILGFVIWLKVSTDLFFIMALCLCCADMNRISKVNTDTL